MNDLYQKAINNPTLKSLGSGVYNILTGGQEGQNASQIMTDLTTGKRKYGDLSDSEQKQLTQHSLGMMMGQVQPIQSIAPENANIVRGAMDKIKSLTPLSMPETGAIEDLGATFGTPYNLRKGVDHEAIVKELYNRISKYIPQDIPQIHPK